MNLTGQMKVRRKQLGLQQKDMKLRVGMEQQQYSRIEAGGNANLKNLELIAEGLDAELILVPKEILLQVRGLLENIQRQKFASKTKKISDIDKINTLQSKIASLSDIFSAMKTSDSEIAKINQLQVELKNINTLPLPEIKLNDSTVKAMQQLQDSLDNIKSVRPLEIKISNSTLKAVQQIHATLDKIYKQANIHQYQINKIDDPWEDILEK